MWQVADLVRDTFKRGKYLNVSLPLKVVLRRPECVLARTKPKVLAVHAKYRGRIEDLRRQLRRASGFGFYNASRYNFAKLLADAAEIARNLRHYIIGFSANKREMLEEFDFDEYGIEARRSGSSVPSGAAVRRSEGLAPSTPDLQTHVLIQPCPSENPTSTPRSGRVATSCAAAWTRPSTRTTFSHCCS